MVDGFDGMAKRWWEGAGGKALVGRCWRSSGKALVGGLWGQGCGDRALLESFRQMARLSFPKASPLLGKAGHAQLARQTRQIWQNLIFRTASHGLRRQSMNRHVSLHGHARNEHQLYLGSAPVSRTCGNNTCSIADVQMCSSAEGASYASSTLMKASRPWCKRLLMNLPALDCLSSQVDMK